MTTTETIGHAEVPPIPDVPFLIGLHAGDGLVHAVSHGNAMWALERFDGSDERDAHAAATCGAVGTIARYWGEFRRDNTHLLGQAGHLCPFCCWVVALDQGTTEAELAAITPTGAELEALERLLPGDPMPVTRICKQVLARRGRDDERDPEDEYWPQILGSITEHRPELVVFEACGDRECDHDSEAQCFAEAIVACAACSILTGSWAGEWEGQYECIVPAPCSALLAMAEKYGVEVAR